MEKIYEQLQRLTESECANYCESECLPADKPCMMVAGNGDICGYFAEAVLPLDITLQRAVLSSDADQISMKCCEDCGAGFKPTGRSQGFAFCVERSGSGIETPCVKRHGVKRPTHITLFQHRIHSEPENTH